MRTATPRGQERHFGRRYVESPHSVCPAAFGHLFLQYPNCGRLESHARRGGPRPVLLLGRCREALSNLLYLEPSGLKSQAWCCESGYLTIVGGRFYHAVTNGISRNRWEVGGRQQYNVNCRNRISSCVHHSSRPYV